MIAAACLIATTAIAPAQQITGTLTGIVTDNTGAVIPGAQIVLINDASGNTLRTETNAQGFFAIAAVFSGNYTLRISTEGFAQLERTGIVMRPGDKRNLSDLIMQVGATTETITVSAAADTITPVDSGEQSTTITSEQLQNLSVVGRSAAELIKIIPGMAPTGSGLVNQPGFSGENIGINGNGDGGRQSALGYFSANGQPGSAMDIVTDGANTADPGCNCATPVNPNVDMLQEFKVLTGTYSAEHSKGPVVMNAVTKGGGRDFHGGAYYYLRDYRLNSNEWALNRAGLDRPKNQYQFPGGNIGGPVIIPGTNFNKDRNKIFFFTGFEYYKQRIDTGVLRAIVPDEAMRAGDFSNTAYLRALGNPDQQATPSLANGSIVNGRIPQALLDPRGQAVMKLFPLPNVDPAQNAGSNYVDALLLDQNMWQWTNRVDFNISDYTKLFVRYNHQSEVQNFPVQLWGRSGNSVPYPTNVVGDNISKSVSVSLTNVFSPTMTNEVIFGHTFIDFPNRLDDPAAASRTAIGLPIEGIYDNGIDQIPNVLVDRGGARIFNRGGFDPVYPATKWLTSLGDNFSMFKGSHTMKFGFYWQRILQDQPNGGESQGRYTFRPNHGLTTGNSYADMVMGIYQRYQEQNFNAEQRQVYNVFEGYMQDSWKVNQRLTLEFGLRFSHLQPWRDQTGETGFGIFRPGQYNPNAGFEDLTGFFYNAIDPSVPLGGFPSRTVFVQPRIGFALDVFGTGGTIIRGGGGTFRYNEPTCCAGSFAVAQGQRSTNTGAPGYMREVDAISPTGIGRTALTVVDQNDDEKPTSYNWSFEIGQRLPEGSFFTAAYSGNASRNLLNGGGLRNINQVPLGAMLNTPDAPSQNFVPFSLYNAINVIRHDFYSNYHSLQTRYTKQTRNVSIQASYTFSKVLGIRGGGSGDTADNLNRDNNYGVLSLDRTHLFALAYNWDLGSPLRSAPALARGIVNGWQISGISTVGSGVELAASDQTNFDMQGFLPDGTRIQSTSVIGSPAISPQPFVICDPRKNLADGQFINGNCFAPPGRGQNGDYVFPYLRSPALMSHDISAFKNFNIDEHKRIQLRFSAYNFLNQALDTFLAGDNNLDLNFDEAGNQTNSRFGFADNKVGKRIIQLAVKFYF